MKNMLLMRMILRVYGDHFRRSEFENKIKDEFYIDNEFNDFQHRSSIENPSRVGIEYELGDYQEWYVAFIEKYYQEMLAAGATEINLMTSVFYSEQCNFEIFDQEMMSRLGKYPIAFPISIYNTKVSELKEIKALRKKGAKISHNT